jgi:hypothetical protein
MSIHSLEILISEAARTRSIPYGTKIVPRFSDLHCLLQTAKFVLAEMDDTIENRNRILASIVSDATKEVSTFYLSEIPFEKLEGLRREFKDGRAFVTSQDALGSKIGNVAYESEDYESQVDRFLVLKYIVEKVSKKVIIEQERFEESAIGNGIDVTFVSVQKKIDSEFLASIIELVLEGLRFIDPPLIERKNGSYVSSKI